jgi:hypothetical protein
VCTAAYLDLCVQRCIENDYTNSYFLTGEITASAYAPDCEFIDPTIRFTGLDTWMTNISALKARNQHALLQ